MLTAPIHAAEASWSQIRSEIEDREGSRFLATTIANLQVTRLYRISLLEAVVANISM